MEDAYITVLNGLKLKYPSHLTYNAASGDLTVCESLAKSIHQFHPSSPQNISTIVGIVNNINDGTPSSNNLVIPRSFAFDQEDPSSPPNAIYICDTGAHCVKMFDFSTKTLKVIAGNGMRAQWDEKAVFNKLGSECALYMPQRVIITEDQSTLVILDSGTKRILLLSLHDMKIKSSFFVQVLPLSCEFFTFPRSYNTSLFFGSPSSLDAIVNFDMDNITREKVTLERVLVCGSYKERGFRDGPRYDALFDCIFAIQPNSFRSKIYLSDFNNYRIRMFDFATFAVSTVAGNGEPGITSGPALSVPITSPYGLCWMNNGDMAVSCGHELGRICIITNLDPEETTFMMQMQAEEGKNALQMISKNRGYYHIQS